MKLYKMHGTENTFYLYDVMNKEISEEQMRNMTIELCQDGSDGMLFVCDSKDHLAKMRIINSDGSEPEMCGNGLRCLARYVLEKMNVEQGTIETLKTAYSVKRIEDFYGINGIQIILYPVKTWVHDELDSFDTDVKLRYYNVSNPHVVGEIKEYMSEKKLNEIGKRANDHFSEGINVNLVQYLDEGKIYVQTYERGVGITKSCGTGMTSSSVDYAIKKDYFDKPIEVYNDGGMIECMVTKTDDYSVRFTGNATYVSEHELDGRLIKVYDEAEAYKNFFKKTRGSG